MTHLYLRQSLAALCGLCLLLGMSAYQAGSSTVAAAATTEATASVAATSAATDASTGFNLNAPAVGLSDLSSYQSTLVFTFTGTRQGQNGKWSKTFTMLARQKPAVRQVTVDSAGDTPTHEMLWEMNGAQYDVQGQNPCAVSVVEKGGSLADRWEPARYLDRFKGGQLVGSETVNGVETNHYKFDEQALKAAQSTGDAWIATSGGYVVKYVLTSQGGADRFGDGSEGTATWDYELAQANQPISIALPKDCPVGLVDAPLLPDAANVLRLPGLLTYHTATQLTDITAFYQKQLPALGWKVSIQPMITDTTAVLSFSQGDLQLSVSVVVENGGTTVQLILESGSTGTSGSAGTPAPTRAPAGQPTRAPGGTLPRPPAGVPTLPALPPLPFPPPKR